LTEEVAMRKTPEKRDFIQGRFGTSKGRKRKMKKRKPPAEGPQHLDCQVVSSTVLSEYPLSGGGNHVV